MSKDNFLDILESFDLDDHKIKTKEVFKKAPFVYPGSKFRSLKHILNHIPYRRKYVEPFGGSGTVLLNRDKSTIEVFNDRNSGIVDFYKSVRSDPSRLRNLLSTYLNSREEFITCRDTYCNSIDPFERAAMWYYSVEMSFSGHGRAFGRAINSPHKDITEKFPLFDQVHNRLKNVLIENTDAIELIKDYDSEDTVFYLDPPYLVDEGSYYDKYEHTLSRSDHIRLLETIMACKGFVALSGYHNELYDSYNWTKTIDYEILISADAKNKDTKTNKRGMRREYLWLKS